MSSLQRLPSKKQANASWEQRTTLSSLSIHEVQKKTMKVIGPVRVFQHSHLPGRDQSGPIRSWDPSQSRTSRVSFYCCGSLVYVSIYLIPEWIQIDPSTLSISSDQVRNSSVAGVTLSEREYDGMAAEPVKLAVKL